MITKSAIISRAKKMEKKRRIARSLPTMAARRSKPFLPLPSSSSSDSDEDGDGSDEPIPRAMMAYRNPKTVDSTSESSDSEEELIEKGIAEEQQVENGYDSDVIIIEPPTPPRRSSEYEVIVGSTLSSSKSRRRSPSVEYLSTSISKSAETRKKQNTDGFENRQNSRSTVEQSHQGRLRDLIQKYELSAARFRLPSPMYNLPHQLQPRSLSPVIANRKSCRSNRADSDIEVIGERFVTTRSPSPFRCIGELSPPFSRRRIRVVDRENYIDHRLRDVSYQESLAKAEKASKFARSYESHRFSAYGRRSNESSSSRSSFAEKIGTSHQSNRFYIPKTASGQSTSGQLDNMQNRKLGRVVLSNIRSIFSGSLTADQSSYPRHPIQEEMVQHVRQVLGILSKSTNCQLEILCKVERQTWRWMTINGAARDVEKAKDTINEWIMKFQERKQITSFLRDPRNLITVSILIDVPEIARSHLVGPEKEPFINSLECSGHLNITNCRAESAMRSPPLCIKGDNHLVNRTYQEFKNIINQVLEKEKKEKWEKEREMEMEVDGDSEDEDRKQAERMRKQEEAEKPTKVHIMIPRYCVGGIMGRKGANVQRIVKMTGTKVMMLPDIDPTGDERIFMVKGEHDAVQIAMKEIQKQVDLSVGSRP